MGRKREVFPPLVVRMGHYEAPSWSWTTVYLYSTVDGPMIFDDPSCLSSSVSHHLDCLCMHRPGPKPGSTNSQYSRLSLSISREAQQDFSAPTISISKSFRLPAEPSILSVCLRRGRKIWTASLSSASRGCVCGGFQHLEPAPSAAVIGPDESPWQQAPLAVLKGMAWQR